MARVEAGRDRGRPDLRSGFGKFGWDLARIAKESGKKEEQIKKRMALLKLLPEIQQLVRSKAMPIAHQLRALVW